MTEDSAAAAAASAAQAASSAADAGKSAEEAKKAATPSDPEATWPPRFVPRSLFTAGLMLALLFLALTGFFREVFDGAGLLKDQTTSANVGAYVLFEVGLLALLAALFFALVEARTPPPPAPVPPTLVGRHSQSSFPMTLPRRWGCLRGLGCSLSRCPRSLARSTL